jgi:hypothetical protein
MRNSKYIPKFALEVVKSDYFESPEIGKSMKKQVIRKEE